MFFSRTLFPSRHILKVSILETDAWRGGAPLSILRRDGAACEISGKQQRDDFDCVWCGAFGCPIFPGAIFAGRFGCSAGDVWRGSVQKLLLGGLSMKWYLSAVLNS